MVLDEQISELLLALELYLIERQIQETMDLAQVIEFFPMIEEEEKGLARQSFCLDEDCVGFLVDLATVER
ncbi:hypothetical protein ACVWZ4_003874 [Bradyrhizobium sp. USDA 4472]